MSILGFIRKNKVDPKDIEIAKLRSIVADLRQKYIALKIDNKRVASDGLRNGSSEAGRMMRSFRER